MAKKMVPYLVNEETQRKFRVISLSEDGSTITLKGERGEFTDDYDKAKFVRLGYKLVKIEEEVTEDA
jgi:hypothetical protein